MAKIYNSDLSKELVQGAKIQQNVDKIPNELADKVVPVMEVNPKLLRRCNIMKHSASSATGVMNVYSVPTDKDFYLCGMSAGFNKDVNCDLATGFITVSATPSEGVTAYPIIFSVTTLTAESGNTSVTINPPILLKKNTTLSVSGAYTAGTANRSACIWGYTVDNINA